MMLQDLLLALYGIPGAIFIESDNQSTETKEEGVNFQLSLVSKQLPFIPPGEADLCHQLLKLGTYYGTIEKFIQRYTGSFKSLYLSALACGFDRVLDDYRENLVQLESEILADQDLNIAHVSCRLHTFRSILPFLASLASKVDDISRNQDPLIGCKLLDVIISATPSGLPGPRTVMHQLLASLMRIFCRQLHSWLVLGILDDPHGEFFIKYEKLSATSTTKVTPAMSQESKSQSGAYDLVGDRIPDFLPNTFAHQVLSSGESINLITQSCPRSSLLKELHDTYSPKFQELSTLYANATSPSSAYNNSIFPSVFEFSALISLVSEVRTFISSNMWKSLVTENDLPGLLGFIKDVALSGRGELFLAFVDQTRSLNLSTRLNDGIAPVTFDRGLLDQPVPHSESDIKACEYEAQAAFLSAARLVGVNDEALDDHFRLTLSTEITDNENNTLWDQLHLRIIVPDVHRAVFSRQVLQGYDRMFRFLSFVRRTQLALQKYWAEQTVSGRRAYLSQYSGALSHGWEDDSPQPVCDVNTAEYLTGYDRRLIIRNYMAFFVENLQYYLQVDVIESQFSHLLDLIQSSEQGSTESILAAHEAFVASLQAQCLLFHPTAKACIYRLLRICQQFVSARKIHQESSDCSQFEETLFREFRKLSSQLFRCLSSTESVGATASVGLDSGSKRFGPSSSPKTDLTQLLLRMDFNYFFTRDLNERLCE